MPLENFMKPLLNAHSPMPLILTRILATNNRFPQSVPGSHVQPTPGAPRPRGVSLKAMWQGTFCPPNRTTPQRPPGNTVPRPPKCVSHPAPSLLLPHPPFFFPPDLFLDWEPVRPFPWLFIMHPRTIKD